MKVHANGNGLPNVKLIERQTKIHTRRIPNVRSLETMRNEFQLDDAMYYCKTGIEVSKLHIQLPPDIYYLPQLITVFLVL